MLHSHTAVALITKIMSLFSYAITIPVLGYVRAWTAKKLGDDTPEQLGFLTLDPLVHYSFFWLAFMVIIPNAIPIGFGKYVPLYSDNFRKPYQSFKVLCAYFSDTIVSLIIAFLGLLLFVFLQKTHPIVLLNSFMYVAAKKSYAVFNPAMSSSAIMFYVWLANLVLFNIVLATFNFILNVFYALYFGTSQKDAYYGQYTEWIMLVVPLFFLLFFQEYLYQAFLFGITYLVDVFGLLLGVR